MNKSFPVLAAGLFLLVFIVPSLVRPLGIADEARYAEIPREMLETGDWVVPHLNGLRYFEKPPLGYWLTALSEKALGQNHFAARLPSALSAGLTALLVFWLVRRQSGDSAWARLSAIIYLTSVLVFAVGVTCVLDGMFTLFLTAAIACFFAYDQEVRPSRQTLYLCLFGLCCALAFLTKGFLAVVLPAIVMAPYLIWSRKWQRMFQFPVLPIVVAIAVVLPWAVAIHLREPDFWRYFIWEEHVRRFAADNAQHHQPFYYFLHILALGLLPWTFVVPAAVRGWQRTHFAEPLLRYALCWFVMPFLFFSASKGKLGTYILPCLAPLAILLARGLIQYLDKPRRVFFDWAALLLAAGLIVAAVALAGTQIAPGFSGKVYAASETGDWVTLLGAMLVWAVLAAVSARAASPSRKLAFFAAAPVMLYATLGASLPYQTDAARSAESFLTEHAHRIPADSIVVGDDKRVHSGCWFLKRDDLYVFGGGEFVYGLSYPEARDRGLDLARLAVLLARSRGHQRVTLFTVRDRWEEYGHLLPTPSFLDYDEPQIDEQALIIAQFD